MTSLSCGIKFYKTQTTRKSKCPTLFGSLCWHPCVFPSHQSNTSISMFPFSDILKCYFLWKHNKCMWHPHNPLYYCLKTTTFPSETGPSSESFPRCSLGFLNYWKVIVVNMLSLFSYKLSLGLEIVQCQDKERIGSGHHHSLHDLIKSRRVQSEVKPSLTSLDFVFLKRNDPNHLHCIWEKLIFQQHIVENRNHM